MMHEINKSSCSTACGSECKLVYNIFPRIPGRNQRVTISFSATRDIIGVTDIGRKSENCWGCGTLGTGVTIADNQETGTLPELKDKFSRLDQQ